MGTASQVLTLRTQLFQGKKIPQIIKLIWGGNPSLSSVVVDLCGAINIDGEGTNENLCKQKEKCGN
jgi:hypothetical protein